MLKFCREACLKPLSRAKVLPAREAFASESQAGLGAKLGIRQKMKRLPRRRN